MGPDLLAPLAGRLRDAATSVFPGLGHFGPLEDPAAVAVSVGRAVSSPSTSPGEARKPRQVPIRGSVTPGT
jgi:hypothetical protein